MCNRPTTIPLIKLIRYIYSFKFTQDTELIKTHDPIVNRYWIANGLYNEDKNS